ncbi:hypothetical protein BKA67DRAFT_542365 [Truncatella angustata]|uniref:Uncharacterized protein n=1 Tax=Truncatella angustata TaxID=152316 RepID=A0A9P8U846_9PEZI|nr:uncharacterized protein BKA67DRAFT_542365 [Truncatella angustata]KAH6643408.1 hypothetical protein BKA67DRAFT_542365 [Truncatella angustata]
MYDLDPCEASGRRGGDPWVVDGTSIATRRSRRRRCGGSFVGCSFPAGEAGEQQRQRWKTGGESTEELAGEDTSDETRSGRVFPNLEYVTRLDGFSNVSISNKALLGFIYAGGYLKDAGSAFEYCARVQGKRWQVLMVLLTGNGSAGDSNPTLCFGCP